MIIVTYYLTVSFIDSFAFSFVITQWRIWIYECDVMIHGRITLLLSMCLYINIYTFWLQTDKKKILKFWFYGIISTDLVCHRKLKKWKKVMILGWVKLGLVQKSEVETKLWNWTQFQLYWRVLTTHSLTHSSQNFN